MRTVLLAVLVPLLLTRSTPVGRAAPDVGSPLQQDVVGVLHEARAALGGESSLNAVRALKGVGRSDRIVGPVRLTGEVELRLAFPDRYVRIERLLFGQMSAEIATGFSGAVLIQRARGPEGFRLDPTGSATSGSAGSLERSTLGALRRDAALLLLGFFSSSFDLQPLRFADGGAADSPDGRAQVIAVTGEEGLDARLFIDARTHLPLLVSWIAPDAQAAARAASESRAAAGTPADPSALLEQARPAEHRLYFGDYRPVEGVRWPFRLRRSVGGHVIEELTFDRYTLNPSDGGAFEPGR